MGDSPRLVSRYLTVSLGYGFLRSSRYPLDASALAFRLPSTIDIKGTPVRKAFCFVIEGKQFHATIVCSRFRCLSLV